MVNMTPSQRPREGGRGEESGGDGGGGGPRDCLVGSATVTSPCGPGRGGGAQEVELEAEAEAVVVAGPRSVLLPSVVAEALVGVEAAA